MSQTASSACNNCQPRIVRGTNTVRAKRENQRQWLKRTLLKCGMLFDLISFLHLNRRHRTRSKIRGTLARLFWIGALVFRSISWTHLAILGMLSRLGILVSVIAYANSGIFSQQQYVLQGILAWWQCPGIIFHRPVHSKSWPFKGSMLHIFGDHLAYQAMSIPVP